MKASASKSQIYKLYPPVSFFFEVKIVDPQGRETSEVDASFQEVTGISSEIQVEDFSEGGENTFTYKLPKAIKYSPLQLKRGLIPSSSALGEWCRDTFELGFEKRIVTHDLQVSLLHIKEGSNGQPSGEPLMSWKFIGAYPTKWNVSNFNAQNNDIVVETLEFTYRNFVVEK